MIIGATRLALGSPDDNLEGYVNGPRDQRIQLSSVNILTQYVAS